MNVGGSGTDTGASGVEGQPDPPPTGKNNGKNAPPPDAVWVPLGKGWTLGAESGGSAGKTSVGGRMPEIAVKGGCQGDVG